MSSTAEELVNKVVKFQRNILVLKEQIIAIEEKSGIDKSKTLLTQIEWYECVSQICADISGLDSNQASAIVMDIQGLGKSLIRLQAKMQRYFNSIAVVKLNEQDLYSDSTLMKIIETRQDPLLSDGAIVEVIRPGYRFNQQLLRKAEVITVKNKEPHQ